MGGAPWAEDATEEDDRALARRATHDRAAFALLYRRYVVPVYRYCGIRLASHEAAEDATADIFARAFAGLGGYRGDRPFRAWLFAIAHNTVANAHRARARRPSLPLAAADLVADVDPSPEERVLAREAREDVRALLDHLPQGQREVVALRLAGLTGVEVAQALGRSPGAVKIAQIRAYARLRDLLTGGFAGKGVGARNANAIGEEPTRER